MLVLATAMAPLVLVQETSTSVDVLEWAERLSGLIWLAFVVEYAYLFRLAADSSRPIGLTC